ncbi:MAG: hypothetical protein ACI9CD_001091 [Candidatus Deianiraeaceae bacterium]|jgi:hypothetical protein
MNYISTKLGNFTIKIDSDSSFYNTIVNNLPITGKANNIGGEIFYSIDIDIPFDGSEKEVFNVGDIVYWRSQKEKKFAIAIFYGNTKFGTGKLPTAASPCMKFATIEDDGNTLQLAKVETGSDILIK